MSGIALAASEGLWGFVVLTLVVIPLSNISEPGIPFYENSIEIIDIFKLNLPLLGIQFGYVICVTLYSLGGFLVTEQSTAIHRNMYEIIRPFPVWILSTLLYAIFNSTDYGGEKPNLFSVLEIGGFLVSVFGILVFNRTMKFNCFTYQNESDDEAQSDLYQSLVTLSY